MNLMGAFAPPPKFSAAFTVEEWTPFSVQTTKEKTMEKLNQDLFCDPTVELSGKTVLAGITYSNCNRTLTTCDGGCLDRDQICADADQ
jgi:hypothetical protein